MRQILTYKLFDGTKLSFICDANDKQSAHSIAMTYSKRLFRSKKFMIKPKTEIVDYERWSKDKQSGARAYGTRKFNIAIVYNGQSLVKDVQADGVKSAYNIIKKQHAIPGEPMAFIYDTTQDSKLYSVLTVGQNTFRSKDKLDKLIDDFVKEANKVPGAGTLAADVVLWKAMCADIMNGSYNRVPYKTIIETICVMIYLVCPINLSFEIVPIVGQADDVALVALIAKSMHDDVQDYKKWRNDTSIGNVK